MEQRREGDVADRTRYQGDGIYDVRCGTRTTFTAHSPDGRRSEKVLEMKSIYFVRIQVIPEKTWYGTVRQKWTVLGTTGGGTEPDRDTIVQTLEAWPHLASKNGDW